MKVKVDVPLLPAIVAGLKLAVMPAGIPLIARFTLPWNPLEGVTVIGSEVLVPISTDNSPGPYFSEIVKQGEQIV